MFYGYSLALNDKMTGIVLPNEGSFSLEPDMMDTSLGDTRYAPYCRLDRKKLFADLKDDFTSNIRQN